MKSMLALIPVLTLMAMPIAAENVVMSETFDSQDAFNQWEIIDNNGGRTWEFLNGTAAYMLDYQTGLPGDDWLISNSFTLEAGKAYDLSLYMRVMTKPESLRIYIGTARTPDAMTKVIADFSDVNSDVTGNKEFLVSVSETGEYYLGFYAYSKPNGHRVEVDNIIIAEYGDSRLPAAVTNLTVAPGADGAPSAEVTLVAPSLDIVGNELVSLDRIDVFRGEQLVKSFDMPTMGSTVSFNDTDIPDGFASYSAIAVNEYGSSKPLSVTEYIGIDTPEPVKSFVAKANPDQSVTLSWEAPTTSVNGGYIDFTAISYSIVRSDGVDITGDFSNCTFTDPRPVASGQSTISYTITASFRNHNSKSVTTNKVLCGEPLELPYHESFANTKYSTPWVTDAQLNAMEWSLTFDDEEGEVEEVVSQDRDNGMLTVDSRYADYGAQSRIVSPMINLNTVSVPELTFYFYQARSSWYDPEWDGEINDRMQVQIAFDGGDWTDIDGALYYQNVSPTGWVKCVVSLPQNPTAGYANIGLLATAESDGGAYRNMYVDNFTIDESATAHDLAVTTFAAEQKRVDPGTNLVLHASVRNRGNDVEADAYSVVLMRDGNEFTVAESRQISAASSADFSFTVATSMADATTESIDWSVKVMYADDENTDNNTSDIVSTSVRRPDLPIVEKLDGNWAGNVVTLNWDEAQSIDAPVHDAPVQITDDFEQYDAFIIDNIGDWRVVDVDKANTLTSPRIGNYPHKGEPMAFQVFNAVEAGVWTDDNRDQALQPYSGNSYLMCPSTDYPAENDDWLITPRLDSRAQTVSFMAKAASYDSEWIKVYYSTTDNHIDSFEPLNDDKVIYVGDFWRKYSYELPDGVRYFAVRCVRRSVFLFIDDFTYNTYDELPDAATLQGYNVYRNGIRLNTEPLTEALYEDADALQHIGATYNVTAVYTQGESYYSNDFVLSESGVNGVSADAIAVTARNGIINASWTGVQTARVLDLSGRCIHHVQGQKLSIALPAGVYLVNIGKAVKKVILTTN